MYRANIALPGSDRSPRPPVPGSNSILLALAVWALLGSSPLQADSLIRQEPLPLGAGQPVVTLDGRLVGYEIVDYQLDARQGEVLAVDFTPDHPAAHFNLLPPASESALFIGSIRGNRFIGPLPADGTYTLRVYLMRSAARRQDVANYQLTARLEQAAPPCFSRSFALQGITFNVTSYCVGAFSSLKIIPKGLEIDNAPILRIVDGTVSGVEVDDLNADGSPEIYVYVTSAGSGSYGSLIAYSSNQRKSLSDIYLPPLEQQPENAVGYQGHDEFAVLEGGLVRRFPIYREGDSNSHPTGGMRQLQYKLVPGEAGWLLEIDRVVEY
jgi:hypothetical protein